MKRSLDNNRRFGGQRGDTIVEVLLALAVLGAVLGGAYVISNRNIITNRMSQERLEATKLAEAQLEKIKSEASRENSSFFDSFVTRNNFCFSSPNATATSSGSSCRLNASGNITTEDPSYHVNITTSPPVGSRPQPARLFNVTVEWTNAKGSGEDRLNLLYEVSR